MADMFLNLDLSGGQCNGQAQHGNRRHQQFMKRRKFLERRGYLKQKQLPPKPTNKKVGGQPPDSWDHTKHNGQRGGQGDNSQRTPKSHVNFFHSQQQGAQSVAATVTSNHAPPKAERPSHTGVVNGHTPGAKDQSKPSVQLPSASLLSEFSSGLPSYKVVAIDCEMVGTGPKGSVSALARCSIVGYHGDIIYDRYIRPANPVTDYRTRWSGVRREHLANAVPFAAARKEILKLLQGKMVVGHAIQNDYKALGYFHPQELTRDTSKIPLLNRKAGFPEKEMASLKRLAKQLLCKDIQTGRGGHSSVEDAKTTMELYRVVEVEYERELVSGHAH
ncbi:interferon-stimulated 20 kDa exonuclease-like 2 [Gastrophryne carolinensis]